MIIACPECTSPFEVADGHIAPLVQVECPTCNFRMILDFEAANDASLREDGMAMAQGFRDEAGYRQAVGAGQVVYSSSVAKSRRPELRAVPDQPESTPPVREPVPEPTREPQPVVTPPVRQAPPIEQPPIAQPVQQPPVERQPVVLEQPPLDKPPVRHPPGQPVTGERPRSRPTLIAHTPPPPQPIVTPAEPVAQPTASPQSEAQIETHQPGSHGPTPAGPGSIAVDLDDEVGIEVDVDEPEVARPVEAAAPVRTPPHTPVREPTTEPGPEVEVPRPDPGVTSSKPTGDQEAKPDADQKGSGGKTALKLVFLFLLLAAGGLMTWSMVMTGDPFQKILELVGAAPPADANQPDGKADKKANE